MWKLVSLGRLVLILHLIASPATARGQGPESEVPRPNLVVFLVDDLGVQDTSVPFGFERTALNRRYRTPHLEALAERGVRFGQAYACAVCSPSRTSLLTGRNAARHRVTNWTFDPSRDTSGKGPLGSPPQWRRDGLQPGDGPTLAQLLQNAGYFTIHAGKAHWGAQGTAGADPCNLGFDVNIAGHHAGGPGGYAGQTNYSAAWRGGSQRWDVPGLGDYHGLPVHLTDATTVEALRAARQAVKRNQPFFLHLAHYAVHAPIEPHPPYDGEYPELDRQEAKYASMVEGVDASLGSVLRFLEREGIAQNTLVLFLSDNGGLAVHSRGTMPEEDPRGLATSNAPLRAGKGSAYEGGTRIPCLVAWAASAETHLQARLSIQAGALRQTPVLIEDWFPTLLDWAGIEPPGDRDGRTLTELLAREGAGPRDDRALVFHYPHVWGPRKQGHGYSPHSSLRQGGYKVIWFYETQHWELYDLVADPAERVDRAALEPDRVRQLAGSLRHGLERYGALFPTDDEGATVLPQWP